ncbi:MAG: DUF882 domain-containing protein [Polyangiaceae bacterium]|nr:DUF882 domain-containing protein [Polyangiaceae bacterium]
MMSRQLKGGADLGAWWRRALGAAAALALLSAPWLSSSPALAAEPAARAAGDVPAAHAGTARKSGKAQHRPKAASKKPASAAGAAPARGDSKEPREAKAPEAKAPEAKAPEAKRAATASRAGASPRAHGKKKASRAAPAKPCAGPAISIDRGGLEPERMSLVDCSGKPLEEARRRLSVLARPWGAERPAHLPDHAPKEKARPGKTAQRGDHGAGAEIAPGVRLVDPGLLSRIDALARKYPGKPVSLVSGYRPQSRGSLHQSARAVDMRIAGVGNEELAAACRALPDTGCGYYPNSSFVHIDVRGRGTGTVSWIDASGPGEPPRYVSAWPPPADEAAPAKPGEPGDEVAASDDEEGTPAREAEVDRGSRGEAESAKAGEEKDAAEQEAKRELRRATAEAADETDAEAAGEKGAAEEKKSEPRRAIDEAADEKGAAEEKKSEPRRAAASAKHGEGRDAAGKGPSEAHPAAARPEPAEPRKDKPKRGKRSAHRRAAALAPEAGKPAQGAERAPRRR